MTHLEFEAEAGDILKELRELGARLKPIAEKHGIPEFHFIVKTKAKLSPRHVDSNAFKVGGIE